MDTEQVVVVLMTFPDRERALALGRTLVEERLAACVNVLPEVRSIYRWEGEVCDEPEVLCLLKTTAARVEALRARAVALHPYQVPEVIALPPSPPLPTSTGCAPASPRNDRARSGATKPAPRRLLLCGSVSGWRSDRPQIDSFRARVPRG